MFDFRRITLICLEKRLSKHKMTICKNLGWPLCPPWLRLCPEAPAQCSCIGLRPALATPLYHKLSVALHLLLVSLSHAFDQHSVTRIKNVLPRAHSSAGNRTTRPAQVSSSHVDLQGLPRCVFVKGTCCKVSKSWKVNGFLWLSDPFTNAVWCALHRPLREKPRACESRFPALIATGWLAPVLSEP